VNIIRTRIRKRNREIETKREREKLNLVGAGSGDLAGNDSEGEFGFCNRHDEGDTSSDTGEFWRWKPSSSVFGRRNRGENSTFK